MLCYISIGIVDTPIKKQITYRFNFVSLIFICLLDSRDLHCHKSVITDSHNDGVGTIVLICYVNLAIN
ncbi:hypothetical protein [Helicobacter sp. T3_23-1056]